MGLWDSFTDAVDDLGDTITGAAEVVVDTVIDGASAVAGAVATVAEPVADFASTLTSPIWAFGETVIDTIQDPAGAVQALGDIITDPVGAVEGAFGTVFEYGTGLGMEMGGIVKGVGMAGVGLVGNAIDSGLGVAGAAGDLAVEGITGSASVANVAMGGFGDDVLNYLDDHVLDQVDSATGGVVDVDFDNGAFTASVGVDDLLGVGVGISGDGATLSSDGPLLGVNVGVTDSHGTTVLFDENLPGVDVPAGADVGFGLDADGGIGVIAQVEDLRGITVGILGDYDATITLDELQAIGGTATRPAPADATTPTEGTTPLDVEAATAEPVADAAYDFGNGDSGTTFDSSTPEPAPEPEPEPQTDFAQELEQVAQQQEAADDVWDDL